jgi:3-hydroxyisobutyrate dehydrogenase-like beta-hydroxyacid dehydrogenase
VTDVTVLGTGLMGAAIVRTLLRQGLSVTVWNRSPEKAAPLVAEGAASAASPTEAIHASPVTLLVIFSYENVTSILAAAAAEGPVGDIVNLVTGSPSEAEDLQRWARDHHVNLLDGALLTYPRGIGGPQTLVVYAGDADVWARQQELLRLLAGASEYLGEDARLANAVDHVALSFVTVTQTAMFATLAYAEALGVPRATAMQRIERSLSTMARYLEYAKPMLETGDFRTTEASIDTWVRSSRAFAEGWNDAGLPGRGIRAAAETIRAAQDAGLGELDLAALYLYELNRKNTEQVQSLGEFPAE